MAIKIQFYTLITTVEIGEKHFPMEYSRDWCKNDGVICAPMGAMNPMDIDYMIEYCEKLGLERFKEENGKKVIGDYYIAAQFGLDLFCSYPPCDWIIVGDDVAWHPSLPMGKEVPTFPCFHGGYYYESKEVWDEAERALMSYNNMFKEFYNGASIQKTEYDDFFAKLKQATMRHEL